MSPKKSYGQKVAQRKKALKDQLLSNSYIDRKTIKHSLIYEIHDNGSRPFIVVINRNHIKVYTYLDQHTKTDTKTDTESDTETDIETDTEIETKKHKLLMAHQMKFCGFWYGFDTSIYECHGNSILVKLDEHEYMHIGIDIYIFKTRDIIIDFVSPLGNNDVPYPLAIGTKNFYFMIEYTFVHREHILTQTTMEYIDDVYDEYYKKYGIRHTNYNNCMKKNLKNCDKHKNDIVNDINIIRYIISRRIYLKIF